MMRKNLLFAVALAASLSAHAQVSDFENIKLADGQNHWTGIDLGDGVDYDVTVSYKTGSCYFPMGTSVAWGYGNLSGFVVSQSTDTDPYGADAAFSSIVGKGANGSKQYAVCTIDPSVGGPEVVVAGQWDDAKTVTGCYVTITPDVPGKLQNGNGFLDRNPYTEGDWLAVIATGLDADGNETGTATCYLADYRAENTADTKWLTDWAWFDLSGLGAVKKVRFELKASDNHYRAITKQVLTTLSFCIDDFGGEAPATAVRAAEAARTVASVSYFSADGKQIPSMVNGVNTVVTVYSDGTTETKKVLK